MNERTNIDADAQINVNSVTILFDKLFPKNKKFSADEGKIRADLEKAIIDEKNIGSALVILEYQLSYAERLSGRRGKILSKKLTEIKSELQKKYNKQFEVNKILSALGKRVLDSDKKLFFQALKILTDQAYKEELNSKAGYDLYFISPIPNNLEEYKNSYIFSGKALNYITLDKEKQSIDIEDMNKFSSQLSEMNPGKSEQGKVHLSEEQVDKLLARAPRTVRTPKEDILAQIIAVFNRQDSIPYVYADSPEKIDFPTQKMLAWIFAQLKSNSQDIFSIDYKESFEQYLERSLSNEYYAKISYDTLSNATEGLLQEGDFRNDSLTRMLEFFPPIAETLLKITAQLEKKLVKLVKGETSFTDDDGVENTEKYQAFLAKFQKIYESLYAWAYNTLYDLNTHQFKSEVEEAIKKHYEKGYLALIEKNKERTQEAMLNSFLKGVIGEKIQLFLPKDIANSRTYQSGFVVGWSRFEKSHEASVSIAILAKNFAEKEFLKHLSKYAKDPKKHANNFSEYFIKALQTPNTESAKRGKVFQRIIDLILSQATRNLTLLSYFRGHHKQKKQARKIIQKTPLSLLLNLIEEMKWEDTAQKLKIISLVKLILFRKNFTIRPSDMNENFRKAVLEIGSNDKGPSRLFDKSGHALWKTTHNFIKQINKEPHNKSTSSILVKTTEPIDIECNKNTANTDNNILPTHSSLSQPTPTTPVAIVNSFYHSSNPKMEDKQAIPEEHITENYQEQNASTSITN